MMIQNNIKLPKESISKNFKGVASSIFVKIFGIFIAIIAYAVGKYYPAVILQWIVAVAIYYLLAKAVKKFIKPSIEKDKKYGTICTILGILGLLGLLSPVIGLIFALPGYILSTEVITKGNSVRKRLLIFTGIMTLICILNANYGSIIFSN